MKISDILIKQSGASIATAVKTKPSAFRIEQPKENADGTEISVEETAVYRRLVRHILKQVGDKTGFFLEERLKIILKPYSDTEKSLVRLDNVFAVSIHDYKSRCKPWLTKFKLLKANEFSQKYYCKLLFFHE